MAKPVVDGMERELGERVRFVRVDITSREGRQIAGQYGIRGVPALIVFDGEGQAALRQYGRPQREIVRQVVHRLIGES